MEKVSSSKSRRLLSDWDAILVDDTTSQAPIQVKLQSKHCRCVYHPINTDSHTCLCQHYYGHGRNMMYLYSDVGSILAVGEAIPRGRRGVLL